MVAALSLRGGPATAALEPAEQVRLLRLVLLGRDRAPIAQVGQVGERPRDLVRDRSWRRRCGGRWPARRCGSGAGVPAAPVAPRSGGGGSSAWDAAATPSSWVTAGSGGADWTSRMGGPGARNEPDMSCSYSCLASIIAFLKPIGLTIIRKRSMPASDAVRTSRSPKPNIRPKIDWVRIASLIFSSELSVERLLTTPATSMTRRLVRTYSWLR